MTVLSGGNPSLSRLTALTTALHHAGAQAVREGPPFCRSCRRRRPEVISRTQRGDVSGSRPTALCDVTRRRDTSAAAGHLSHPSACRTCGPRGASVPLLYTSPLHNLTSPTFVSGRTQPINHSSFIGDVCNDVIMCLLHRRTEYN